MTKHTVWREDNRIRATDGGGYSDLVTDDEIRQHIVESAIRAINGESRDSDLLDDAFARAVLAIREFERVAMYAKESKP